MPRDRRLYMTFPIDFHRHPKVQRLSDAAFRAFVEANGESRIAETDGRLEGPDAEFMWSAETLAELVASHPSRPLLMRDGEAYVLRDYAEHQFTKADRDNLSAKRARAGSLGGKAKASAKQVPSNAQQDVAEIGIETDIDGYVPEVSLVSSEVETTSRPEITFLCELLADLIEANGSKRPAIGKNWVDAARLLIDKDGRRPDQIERAIRWCQQDEFWRSNVLSMPKLREKYDQLRLQAAREKQPSDKPTRGQEHLAYIASLGSEQQGIAS